MGCGSSTRTEKAADTPRVEVMAKEAEEDYVVTDDASSVASEPPPPQHGLALFFRPQDAVESVPVEVAPTSTVGDLEAAVKWALRRKRLPWLTWQGASLKDPAALLADLGISPESEVSEEANLEDLVATVCESLCPRSDVAKLGKHIDRDGQTVVHILAQAGETDVLAALVCVALRRTHTTRGVAEELNKGRTTDGKTPCIIAAEAGHAAFVKALHVAGADVNGSVCTSDGGEELSVTPCYVAAAQGHTEVLKVLINAGVEVNKPAVDKHGIETTPCFAASENGHVRSLLVLMEAGADVNSYGKYVCSRKKTCETVTPTHAAVNRGHTLVVMALIRGGADVNKPGKDGWTPCLAAVQTGREDIVRLLIRSGADVNIVCGEETPVRMAAALGFDSVLEDLIIAGGDVNRNLPIIAAYENKQNDAVTLLRAAGADVGPLLSRMQLDMKLMEINHRKEKIEIIEKCHKESDAAIQKIIKIAMR